MRASTRIVRPLDERRVNSPADLAQDRRRGEGGGGYADRPAHVLPLAFHFSFAAVGGSLQDPSPCPRDSCPFGASASHPCGHIRSDLDRVAVLGGGKRVVGRVTQHLVEVAAAYAHVAAVVDGEAQDILHDRPERGPVAVGVDAN